MERMGVMGAVMEVITVKVVTAITRTMVVSEVKTLKIYGDGSRDSEEVGEEDGRIDNSDITLLLGDQFGTGYNAGTSDY